MMANDEPVKDQLILENGGADSTEEKRETMKIDKKLNEYVDGFTVHGLTKVFKAQKQEAFVWTLFILIGLLFAGVVTGRLVFKYYRYETYTEVKAVVTDKNTLPSISICDFDKLRMAYFSYCGSRVPILMKTKNNMSNSRCPVPKPAVRNISTGPNSWANGIFEVYNCLLWNGNPGSCKSGKYLKSSMDDSCFTWNYDGSLFDLYGHLELDFVYHSNEEGRKPNIIVTSHDHHISEIDFTTKLNVSPNKTYEFIIGKTYHKRLPKPYSQCTLEGSDLDIFPGEYSRRTCIETYKMMEAYKKCGDIFDYFKGFLSEDFKKQYEKTGSIGKISECIAKAVEVEPPKDACPFPCHELSLTINSHIFDGESMGRRKRDGHEFVYHLDLQLQNVDTYLVMKEQPLYSAEQMSAEIGGFLGLVLGASILSFIELFAFGILYLRKKLT